VAELATGCSCARCSSRPRARSPTGVVRAPLSTDQGVFVTLGPDGSRLPIEWGHDRVHPQLGERRNECALVVRLARLLQVAIATSRARARNQWAGSTGRRSSSRTPQHVRAVLSGERTDEGVRWSHQYPVPMFTASAPSAWAELGKSMAWRWSRSWECNLGRRLLVERDEVGRDWYPVKISQLPLRKRQSER